MKWTGPIRPRSRTDLSPSTPLYNAATALRDQTLANLQLKSGHETGVLPVMPTMAANSFRMRATQTNHLPTAAEQGRQFEVGHAPASFEAWGLEPNASLGAPRTLTTGRARSTSGNDPPYRTLNTLTCEQCKTQPTHVIIPCHHTVCETHMLLWDATSKEGMGQTRCAQCGTVSHPASPAQSRVPI